ncbi:hypothetical protein BH23BAC1_BH23BAC1_45110 [soil metagenome]
MNAGGKPEKFGVPNDSRSLIFQLKGFISEASLYQHDACDILNRMAYRQIAWCYSLGQSLRGQEPINNLKHYISDNDYDFLKVQNNKPYGLLLLHMNDLKSLLQEKAINSYQ